MNANWRPTMSSVFGAIRNVVVVLKIYVFHAFFELGNLKYCSLIVKHVIETIYLDSWTCGSDREFEEEVENKQQIA